MFTPSQRRTGSASAIRSYVHRTRLKDFRDHGFSHLSLAGTDVILDSDMGELQSVPRESSRLLESVEKNEVAQLPLERTKVGYSQSIRSIRQIDLARIAIGIPLQAWMRGGDIHCG